MCLAPFNLNPDLNNVVQEYLIKCNNMLKVATVFRIDNILSIDTELKDEENTFYATIM